MPKFQSMTDPNNHQNDNRMMQIDATRMMPTDNTRMLTNDANRLMQNDNTRLLTTDNRILTNDNTRLLTNDNIEEIKLASNFPKIEIDEFEETNLNVEVHKFEMEDSESSDSNHGKYIKKNGVNNLPIEVPNEDSFGVESSDNTFQLNVIKQDKYVQEENIEVVMFYKDNVDLSFVQKEGNELICENFDPEYQNNDSE